MEHHMVPVSGRLPDDLYDWLASLVLEGAPTLSDKMRVAVASLKRMHDGDGDYIGTLSMYRDLGRGTREHIAVLEQQTGQHSEVLAALMEHLPALLAGLHSAHPSSLTDAKRLESLLVKRTMQLAETLLRQALSLHAAAYDPPVIQRNVKRLLELSRLLPQSSIPASG
jgi:Arc/MetJ-type ribon-helix-helix transcriptional regulator